MVPVHFKLAIIPEVFPLVGLGLWTSLVPTLSRDLHPRYFDLGLS